MIRLRKEDATTEVVTPAKAVEMLDVKGCLAVVIIQRPAGSVDILTPNDPVFNAYCNAHGLQPSKVYVHEPFDENKPNH